MNLTANDVPIVARAIVACTLKLASIGTVQVNNVSLVHLSGVGFDLYIRGEDWLLIAPYLADGTLNPLVTAYPIPPGDPHVDVSTVDLQDQALYTRVYGLLLSLFPKSYPTSDI